MSEGVFAGGLRREFETVGSHEELIAFSRDYCEYAVSEFELSVAFSRVSWEVSTRAKRRAAAVKRPKVSETAVGDPIDWSERPTVAEDGGAPTCTVSLSWRAFESFDYEEWTATLRHELVHVEQFQRFGTTDHGPAFRRRAAALDAPVRVRHFATPAYLLTCTDCENVVARRYRDCKLVREYESYVSSCCGASLECESPDGAASDG
ncbi:SprT-like domain-containing protein [Halopelagius longus]|uniref:SprT-like family protein n=1 Tax=Halopelagius longus TaxID=1236180 RepID=A0A1H1FM06_9EURY|nr:SprT-like domain-containing protein [Halopelagius longus]SDR01818.1 SprT-like family protein [Halopelagius longus]